MLSRLRLLATVEAVLPVLKALTGICGFRRGTNASGEDGDGDENGGVNDDDGRG